MITNFSVQIDDIYCIMVGLTKQQQQQLKFEIRKNWMQTSEHQQEIYEYIKEYFRFCDLNNTYDVFEKEIKEKMLSVKKNKNSKEEAKLIQIFKNTTTKTKKETLLEKEAKTNNKKYQQVLQAGRQIFSVSINILQLLNSLKEIAKHDNLVETIENYKIQLGKHHKIIINQGKLEGTELISETIIVEHKMKLEQNFNEKNIEGMIEILLSLRVNALQIAPELRKNLVFELIRRDIFKITETDKFEFVLEILNIKNKALRHAMTSLISVISSTVKGVEYLTHTNNDCILQRVIKILKEQEHGNVTQRFCLAILQKCSIKEVLIPTYIDHDMISWTIALVKKSFQIKIHAFCLDFATAMLANVIHSKWCLTYLEKKPDFTLNIIENLLKLINQNIPVSVLMHLLICLSYLNRDKFRKQTDQANLPEKITEFADRYAHSQPDGQSQAAEVDKKTVLDLCAHMFHLKDEDEKNDIKNEQRIKQYENEQNELIFECFQDEVN